MSVSDDFTGHIEINMALRLALGAEDGESPWVDNYRLSPTGGSKALPGTKISYVYGDGSDSTKMEATSMFHDIVEIKAGTTVSLDARDLEMTYGSGASSVTLNVAFGQVRMMYFRLRDQGHTKSVTIGGGSNPLLPDPFTVFSQEFKDLGVTGIKADSKAKLIQIVNPGADDLTLDVVLVGL